MSGISLALVAVLALAGGDVPQTQPAAPPVDPSVDRILTEMEASGAKVNDLKCAVRYIVESGLNAGDRVEWNGTVRYQKTEPHPRFFITFDVSLAGPEGTIRDVHRKKQWYLLENRWLWVVKEAAQQALKVEVAEPGRPIDFFDVEKAPFPFPFGQKKAPLLREFSVNLAAPAPGEESVDHLVCVPKAGGRAAEQWDRIDYYVMKDLHLPQKIVAVEQGGDKVTTTIFPDLARGAINAGLSDKDFAPPAEWKKYGEPIVEPLEGARLAP